MSRSITRRPTRDVSDAHDWLRWRAQRCSAPRLRNLASRRLHSPARGRPANLGWFGVPRVNAWSHGGTPPEIDLTAERAVQAVVRAAISAGEVRTAHDISLGGLAIALAEMAIHSGVGAVLNLETPGRLDELWFGERSASILVATDAATTSLGAGSCASGRSTGGSHRHS